MTVVRVGIVVVQHCHRCGRVVPYRSPCIHGFNHVIVHRREVDVEVREVDVEVLELDEIDVDGRSRNC